MPVRKRNGSLGDRNTCRRESSLPRIEVLDLKRHVSIPRVFFTDVHQNVGRLGRGRVEHQVDLDTGSMLEDGNRLWADGADNEFESQQFVKGSRALQIEDPDTNVRQASNRNGVRHSPDHTLV